MIGTLFIIYCLITLFFVILDHTYEVEGFVDFFQFHASNYSQFYDFLTMYVWFLVLFLVFWKSSYLLLNKYFIKKSYIHQDVFFQKKESKVTVLSWVFVVLIVNLTSMYVTYGNGIFERAEYHEFNTGGFGYAHIIYKFSLFIGCLVLLFGIKRYYVLRIIVVALITLFSLSLATRVTPAIFLVAFLISMKKDVKDSVIYLFLGLFLMFFVLYTRGFDSHGLNNYFDLDNWDVNKVEDILYFIVSYTFNFTYYASLASYELFKDKGIHLPDLITMVNPMPGFLTNWYDINKIYSLTKEAPFTSLGLVIYLLNNSFIGVFVVAYISFLIAVADTLLNKLKNNNKILYVVIFLLGVQYVIYFSQYDLRTSIRYLYYIFVVYFLFFTVKKFKY